MAKVGEDDVYESDPEEEKRLPGMRRREAASDDEEGEDNNERRMDRRSGHALDSEESDDQGGAAEYDDDDDDDDYDDDDDDELIEEEGDEVEGYEEVVVKEKDGKLGQESLEGVEGDEGKGEGEGKKENEPFAVPTAGAFYMHDDRFRENSRGRQRRLQGGRRLWESKDDQKWGHDKFEELTSQARHHEQGKRSSRGNYRGRGGRNRVPDGGYVRRSRPNSFSNGNSQNEVRKVVKGRGPRKYEASMRNSSQTTPMQNKQNLLEKPSHVRSGRVITQASNTESDEAPPARKHSSLSSASPPFYPSGSTNKDPTSGQKRDVQAGNSNRTLRTSAVDESISVRQSSGLTRGKNMANSVGINKLYNDDSITSSSSKTSNNIQVASGSSIANNMQSTQPRTQGRGVSVSAQMNYQPTGNRISSTPQLQTLQRNTWQNRIQPSVQSPGQQLGPHSGSSSRASSPPKTALSVNSYETSEVESTLESSKSRNALVGKGKGTIKGSGRGSFLYGGAQVMTATGNLSGHGDQNFPAFLPVMQFGGQHAGGLGVPTVGVAFPGYVAQPQLGLGNSEMTWLPVLAGAAGALGATYCSPYISVDGAYQSRASGQTSSLGSSSMDSNAIKASNDLTHAQRHEPVNNDEFGQRQKPRRYSEMDFKQPSSSS